jgi:hypothetical protein
MSKACLDWNDDKALAASSERYGLEMAGRGNEDVRHLSFGARESYMAIGLRDGDVENWRWVRALIWLCDYERCRSDLMACTS